MKETVLGSHLRKVPSIAVGCMRLSEKSKDEMNHFIHSALAPAGASPCNKSDLLCRKFNRISNQPSKGCRKRD